MRSGGAWRSPETDKILWSGAVLLNGPGSIPLAEPASAQSTGIVLCWSTSGPSPAGFSTNYIPKYLLAEFPSLNYRAYMGTGASAGGGVIANVRKLITVSDTQITGDSANNADPSNGYVLRQVIGV